MVKRLCGNVVNSSGSFAATSSLEEEYSENLVTIRNILNECEVSPVCMLRFLHYVFEMTKTNNPE